MGSNKALESLTGFNIKNSAGQPAEQGLYDPQYEHDNCGVGCIAALDGVPRMDLVQDAIRILINLEHRGAVGGDKTTGDGAGICLGMPDVFIRHVCKQQGIQLPMVGDYAVAMLFLPTDQATAESCLSVLRQEITMEGLQVLGEREVPIDSSELGPFALTTMPAFRQIFIARGSLPIADFDRKLYVVRRTVEKKIKAWKNLDASQFYVCSMSSRMIIYKGMLTGVQLKKFFPDLTDKNFTSAFAIVHQRYSTNTLPQWSLAQPFRMLSHNGEINTLRGNINRMKSREATLQSDIFGDDLEKIKPILVTDQSDSAIIDNALEFLYFGGRSLPHAMMMLVPEAWGEKYHISKDKRYFYEFHSAIMEPWDGPAALVFTDGRYIAANLDRNGLRPARFTVTKSGILIMASETGVLEIAPENIQSRGRLQPGKMLLLDLKEHRIVPDREIKSKISRQKPYRHWVGNNRVDLRGMGSPADIPSEDPQILAEKHHAFSYTEEELKMVISPMASRSQEAIGSMGNDAPLAVLSNRSQLLYTYFKQLFAQVTNPPIDPLREELVMSLMSYIGREGNLLSEGPENCRMLKIPHPILTPQDMMRIRNSKDQYVKVHELHMLYPRNGTGTALKQALDDLFNDAKRAIAGGATHLILTDRKMDAQSVAIPALLAASGLHHYLIREGLRTQAAIIVESGEVREVIHFSMLIGFGTNAIAPHVAMLTIRNLAEQKMLSVNLEPNEAVDNYIAAIKKGLLKTFSRMGISTIRSYCGSQIFEAIGLNEEIIKTYFTGISSRISGIGLDEIAEEVNMRHRIAYPEVGKCSQIIPMGGAYHTRHGGEKHLWTPQAICKLQAATRNNDYNTFKQYCQEINNQYEQKITLRSLLNFKKQKSIPIEEVEPVENIVKRFVVSAMSFGSISKETHESLAIGANRVGATSNSGEGGEDPDRFKPMTNGDWKISQVKQIASGRFGVTTNYAINCRELQIKVAQGAKPGEGGQLPGHKVTADIGRVRHTTPGVTLISPPPHHDIYSIEDLAQLIYDLKCVNPKARAAVKLVSEVGVGTIASGVAKAQADMVIIAGHDGGTGATPLTSMKYAGLPWELGLVETQLSLRQNGLRDKIRIQVDGQLRTGRDLAIAALLGAEEFGFATVALVTQGCVMMRKCHSNTCPVGVATQDPRLRARFTGKPEYLERFFLFLAQNLREQMAKLGFRTVDQMVGHSEMLSFEKAINHWKTNGLDYSKILRPPEKIDTIPLRYMRNTTFRAVQCTDDKLITELQPAIEKQETVTYESKIQNTDRTVGARLSQEIVRRYGPQGLKEDTINLIFHGSAGQSLGAFLAPGVTITVYGDTNDYVGKSMSGGKIIIRPDQKTTIKPQDNIIAGNVSLYGATSGKVYLNGKVGERFAVRNSGVQAVVEGVGDHGCEYMTGGVVVVLGSTGNNFAAGMSGGLAFVYDKSGLFDTRCNLNMVDLESVWSWEDKATLRRMIEKHVEYTNSAIGTEILNNWDEHLPYFVKVIPVDYRKVLERLQDQQDRESPTVVATEEVFA